MLHTINVIKYTAQQQSTLFFFNIIIYYLSIIQIVGLFDMYTNKYLYVSPNDHHCQELPT